MGKSRKTFLTLALLALLTVVGLAFVPVREKSYQVANHTNNAGELTGEALVGQTFRAEKDNLSAVSIMFATYSGRDNTEPIKFYLKKSVSNEEILREGRVLPGRFGDNQFYQFDFEPVADSGGKTYFFYIVSPESKSGDAVTVDLNNNDPYIMGSAYIARGPRGGLSEGSLVNRSGKQGVDVVFGLHYTVPLAVAGWHWALQAIRTFIATYASSERIYMIWALTAAVAVALVGFILVCSEEETKGRRLLAKKRDARVLFSLLLLAVIIRLAFAVELPVTNDEGNYLYDARTLLEGKLAGGDGYVKAPLFIAWVAMWEMLGGASILAGRLSSVFIGALSVLPVFFLARSLGGRRAGLMAALLWALLGVTSVFNIYVHTQPIALFFTISGLAVLASSLRGGEPKVTVRSVKTRPANINWFVFVGVLLGLGAISRKSILAVGLVPLVMIIVEDKGFGARVKHLLAVGLGFVMVVAVLLSVAGYIYGVEGFWEAIGFNSAEDGLTAVEPVQRELVRAYSLRGMTPFFRESLPLILAALLGLGLAGESLVTAWLRKVKEAGIKINRVIRYLLIRVAWVPAGFVFAWAWSFFAEHEGSSMMIFGMKYVWYFIAASLAAAALLPAVIIKEQEEEDERLVGRSALIGEVKDDEESIIYTAGIREALSAYLVPIVWIAGLIFFYQNWIKFHANYLGEFLPALVVAGGMGLSLAFDKITFLARLKHTRAGAKATAVIVMLLLVGVLLWSSFVSGYVTYMFEHTGTFQQRAVKEAALWAKKNIDLEGPIFTGAAIVPFISGHHTVLDIAHPRWYAYEFTRKDTERLTTFLPSIEEMLQAYRDANWFLLDKQTGFSFLMEYSEIEAGLAKDWERVQGIENGSNTLTFYRRVNRR